MKNKPVVITMLGGFLLSFVAVSNVVAEETTWINTHKFIAGENVQLSHSSPDYPGSITVQPINNNEGIVEIDADPVLADLEEGVAEPMLSEIITRFKTRKDYELTSVSVCLRGAPLEAPPFAIRVLTLGVPTDVGTVAMDEVLFYESELFAATEECSVIPVDGAIPATDETLLLSLSFDSESSLPAIISAVGLGQTSTYLMIDGCNTQIPDIDINGQPFSELIDECAVNAKNHGKFVKCVSRAANKLKKKKIISGKQKGRITKCAAKSSLPN